METKPLLFGIIGFMLGGLLVATAATTFDKDKLQANTSSHMSHQLQGKTGDEFDKAFIDGMIEHHEGAIDMAQLAKKNAKHQEIKALSNDIISAQANEIRQMQQWQQKWGYLSY